MWEQTKRISLRISSVLSKVEPELGAGPLHWLQLQPKSTGSDRLRNTEGKEPFWKVQLAIAQPEINSGGV